MCSNSNFRLALFMATHLLQFKKIKGISTWEILDNSLQVCPSIMDVRDRPLASMSYSPLHYRQTYSTLTGKPLIHEKATML